MFTLLLAMILAQPAPEQASEVWVTDGSFVSVMTPDGKIVQLLRCYRIPSADLVYFREENSEQPPSIIKSDPLPSAIDSVPPGNGTTIPFNEEQNKRFREEAWERVVEEHRQRVEKVDRINAEYYRRTGRKPTPYWDMPN